MDVIVTKSRDVIEVVCDICGNVYKTVARYWRQAQKKGKKHCCSKSCVNKLQRTGNVVKCGYCNKEIYVTKKQLSERENNYCSLQCAHKCINHSHKKTDEQKRKISEILKNHYNSPQFKEKINKNRIKKKCPICGKEFLVSNCKKIEYIVLKNAILAILNQNLEKKHLVV